MYQVGDYVLLSNEHMPVPGQGIIRKLRAIWDGPYKIVARVGEVDYKLALPPTMRIHPVFHVSRLKPYHAPDRRYPDRQSAPVPPVVVQGEEEYQVEALMGDRQRGRRKQFLVKWLGYPSSDNTWEYEDDLRP